MSSKTLAVITCDEPECDDRVAGKNVGLARARAKERGWSSDSNARKDHYPKHRLRKQ